MNDSKPSWTCPCLDGALEAPCYRWDDSGPPHGCDCYDSAFPGRMPS